MKKQIVAILLFAVCTVIGCKKNNVLSTEETGVQQPTQAAGRGGLKPCVCPAVYNPVCGSNGVTYSNACEARCNGITVYTPGACDGGDLNGPTNGCYGKPQPSLNCLDVYRPVCGCDGRVYSNSCYAIRAGIKSYTNGECAF